ncbi:hypothetical protein FRC08_004458 [Ceratobasidium sp. 394]|nr:hypothetical protein FRC08_004458 [Ceratobasidium sp. 394]
MSTSNEAPISQEPDTPPQPKCENSVPIVSTAPPQKGMSRHVQDPSTSGYLQEDDDEVVQRRTWRERLNPQMVLENSGSVARDHLANERTWLAYVRTSLAIASTGVGMLVRSRGKKRLAHHVQLWYNSLRFLLSKITTRNFWAESSSGLQGHLERPLLLLG